MKKIILILSAMTLFGCNSTKNTLTPSVGWSNEYGGADKSYDRQLLTMREEIAPKFQTFEFVDETTGVRLKYNLFIPKNLDPNKKYPLVMFIADASTAGKGTKAPLMQGYGGIIWATEESQRKNPAFVFVPAYDSKAVNDNWETTEQVKITPNLVREIAQKYPIDNRRIYTTGQSMGGMISFYLNSIEPDLFTASMFVGSQWDISVLKPLTKAKFIYTVSAADPKASKGMAEVISLMKDNGVAYEETQFSAKLSQSEQNDKVLAMLKKGKAVNFIQFTPNTVVPKGVFHNGAEHMYSFDYAYLLAPAREWLFEQRK